MKRNIHLSTKVTVLSSLFTFGLVQNAIASTTIVTDAIGTKERWSFEEVLGVQKMTSRINLSDDKGITQTWDSNGNMLTRTDAEGRVMTYAYNAANQRTSMTEASGTPEERTTTYEYVNADIDLVTKTISPSIYGTNSKEVVNTYDANQNIQLVTINGFAADGSPVTRATSFEYDIFGKVTQIDGPRTDTADITTLEYFDCDTGAECGQLKKVTNAAGHVSTYDRYDAAARLLQSTEPNGVITTYHYHPRGWLLGMVQTPPSGAARITTYAYDNVGQLTNTILPDGTEQNYVYDASHALREISDNLGNKVTYQYDAKGNRTDELVFDPSGVLIRSTITTYDIRNFISSINSGGSVTQMVNDAVGNLSTQIDPNENPENGHSFDALDRLNNTVDSLANSASNTYDVADQLIQVVAPNGATTQYEYDDLGNMTKEVSPDRGTVTYTHDDVGNVVSMTDARGIKVDYVYDALNRLTNVTYPSAGENIHHQYDAGAFSIGRMHQSQDNSGTRVYQYDPWGNVVRVENQLRDDTDAILGNFVTQYQYDAVNRLISTTYPNGRKVDISRDEIGRLAVLQTTDSEGQSSHLITSRAYRADGLWTSQSYGNGFIQTKRYDTQGRLIEQDSGSYQRYYEYDSNGNILNVGDVDETYDVDYQYDALDRLAYTRNLLQGLEQNFDYDANGNREGFSENGQVSSLNYQSDSNRLRSIDNIDLTLDPSGRTLQDEAGRQYTYNNAGRLSALRTNGEIIGEYTYNEQQLRTHKRANGRSTLYHYDLGGNLILETTYDGSVIQEYIYADGERIATFSESQNTSPNEQAEQTDQSLEVDQGVQSSLVVQGARVELATEDTQSEPINLSGNLAYGDNQDDPSEGTVELDNSNTLIRLTGNRWRAIPLEYNLTENTVLEFDFSSTLQSEIHAIAFDNDLDYSGHRTFQLYGTQGSTAIDNYNDYDSNGEIQHYIIPVGQFYRGGMSYLSFIMDDDANIGGVSEFSNIKVYEQAPNANSQSELAGFVNVSNNSAYGNDQDDPSEGTVELDNSNTLIRLTGNRWRAAPFDYSITENTVVEFDFLSSLQSEIHAISFDEDLASSGDRTFQLYGTQSWGFNNYRNYERTGGGLQHYRIPVGQFYQGDASVLGFVMDDDARRGGVSEFSNIQVYESSQAIKAEINSVVDLQVYTPYGDARGDLEGTLTYDEDGDGALGLKGNRWQKVPISLDITLSTELTFEFKSDTQGEIHGIGVDNDNIQSSDLTFALWGTQDWGNRTYYGYSGDGEYQSYSIPIGQIIPKGNYKYLVFAMDDDAAVNGQSVFRNVSFIDSRISDEVIDPIVNNSAEDTVHYYINDHLGTPQQLINVAQEITWQATYEAFGNVDITVESVVNNHRFPGQYYDAESGLYYNWNRYYDPEIGRYVTSDPIGLAGGVNTYGYVGGNPLVGSDPMGLMNIGTAIQESVTIAFIGGLAGLACLVTRCIENGLDAAGNAVDGIGNLFDRDIPGDGDSGPSDPACEQACADARDAALASCAGLYGSSSGLFPNNDEALVSCVIAVREVYDDCLAKCRQCN